MRGSLQLVYDAFEKGPSVVVPSPNEHPIHILLSSWKIVLSTPCGNPSVINILSRLTLDKPCMLCRAAPFFM